MHDPSHRLSARLTLKLDYIYEYPNICKHYFSPCSKQLQSMLLVAGEKYVMGSKINVRNSSKNPNKRGIATWNL